MTDVAIIPELEIGQWPKTDNEWIHAIAFIKANLDGIINICNTQAGPNAFVESMPYDKAVLFWYGHVADRIREMTKTKQIAQESGFIEV